MNTEQEKINDAYELFHQIWGQNKSDEYHKKSWQELQLQLSNIIDKPPFRMIPSEQPSPAPSGEVMSLEEIYGRMKDACPWKIHSMIKPYIIECMEIYAQQFKDKAAALEQENQRLTSNNTDYRKINANVRLAADAYMSTIIEIVDYLKSFKLARHNVAFIDVVDKVISISNEILPVDGKESKVINLREENQRLKELMSVIATKSSHIDSLTGKAINKLANEALQQTDNGKTE